MPEGTEQEQVEGPEHTPEESIEHYKAEAEKAIQRREIALKRAREAEQKLQSSGGLTAEQAEEYRALKQQQEEAEHRKALERGEFEKQLEKITSKHSEELEQERLRAKAADEKLRSTLIGLEFSRASDLFGDSGKTVLAPDIAEAYFGRYVGLDDDGNVIVRDRDGNEILDSKGKRASFSEAMTELIESLPNKASILRGSGKTGSGSSGGADQGVRPANRREMAERAQKGDQEALAWLKANPLDGRPSRSVWDRMGV